jgi:hypothetical protein
MTAMNSSSTITILEQRHRFSHASIELKLEIRLVAFYPMLQAVQVGVFFEKADDFKLKNVKGTPYPKSV